MNNSFIANIKDNEYFAVIFTSTRTPGDNGYYKMGDEMVKLAPSQQGFLGIESTRRHTGASFA